MALADNGSEKKQIEALPKKSEEKEGALLAGTVKDLSKVKLDQLAQNVRAGNGQDVKLERERETGFAKAPHIAEAEVLLNQFTQQQKMEMLKLVMEGEQLSEQQKQRIQQIGILKTALLTIRSDIKTSRTWGEWAGQAFTEREGITNLKVLQVDNMIAELDQVVEQITADPNKKIGNLVSQKTRQMLLDYDLDETVPSIMDSNGRIKEAASFVDLQNQYLELVEFLRDRKDYATAQKLIEENLLGPQFAAKRNVLTEAEKKKAHTAARKKILKMASSAQEEWAKQGLTVEQQNGIIDGLVEEDTKRNLNKVVAEMNSGLPFAELKGVDRKIMESYKDMMGTGEWKNFSDESWDKITEEVIINAPLILMSGGAASFARLAVSNGAKILITSARLTRIGMAATRVAKGVEATGRVGKALYWGGNKALSTAGKAGGLLVEGAVFETVYSGLHGENLFEGGWEKFPEWGKRILWSSATLGVFHVAGAQAMKVNNIILKHISKFPDKSIRAAIQKLIVTGNVETAAMLGIGAVQHYAENGEMNDYDLSNELFHALITVGALKIAGGGVEVAKKKFFPKGGPKAGPEGAQTVPEGVANLAETALKGPEGLERAIKTIEGMDHLTLSAKEVLFITSKLPDAASKGRFIKACGEKMTEVQKLEFEKALEAPKGADTVPDVVKDIGGKGRNWLINTMRAAYAHGVAAMEGRNPILVEKPNFATLDIARPGSKSLLFSLDVPGSAKSADAILVEGWQSRSQAEICSLMNTQGIPAELVNKAKASHAEIAPELQPFVRIIVAEGNGKGRGLEPFVLVDQQGIKAKFGLDLAKIEQVLQADGIVMPRTLAELARETGVPVEMWERLGGMSDKEVMSGNVNFIGPISILKLFGWTIPKFFLWDTPKFLIEGKGKYLEWAANRKILTGGEKVPVGPDGKPIEAPKAKPESATFEAVAAILSVEQLKLLSPIEVTALNDAHRLLTEYFGTAEYIKPGENFNKQFKAAVELIYNQIRLKALNKTPVGAAVDIEATRNRMRELLALGKNTDAVADLAAIDSAMETLKQSSRGKLVDQAAVDAAVLSEFQTTKAKITKDRNKLLGREKLEDLVAELANIGGPVEAVKNRYKDGNGNPPRPKSTIEKDLIRARELVTNAPASITAKEKAILNRKVTELEAEEHGRSTYDSEISEVSTLQTRIDRIGALQAALDKIAEMEKQPVERATMDAKVTELETLKAQLNGAGKPDALAGEKANLLARTGVLFAALAPDMQVAEARENPNSKNGKVPGLRKNALQIEGVLDPAMDPKAVKELVKIMEGGVNVTENIMKLRGLELRVIFGQKRYDAIIAKRARTDYDATKDHSKDFDSQFVNNFESWIRERDATRSKVNNFWTKFNESGIVKLAKANPGKTFLLILVLISICTLWTSDEKKLEDKKKPEDSEVPSLEDAEKKRLKEDSENRAKEDESNKPVREESIRKAEERARQRKLESEGQAVPELKSPDPVRAPETPAQEVPEPVQTAPQAPVSATPPSIPEPAQPAPETNIEDLL